MRAEDFWNLFWETGKPVFYTLYCKLREQEINLEQAVKTA